jgi:beta-glucosidase
VLLENNGILPLQTKTPNILLTGPNANSMWAMCGDYSYPSMAYFWKKTDVGGENPHIVTVNEGMTKRMPQGFNLKYSRGCDWTEEIETKYDVVGAGDERAWEYEILHRKVESGEKADAKEALAMAKQSDVIVAAMGENVMLCGENRDRKGIRLPGKQEQYVESLIATGKPVVLVLFGGRAMPLSEKIVKGCAAIIEAWYPGEEGGNALADILYGKISPSAKLSVSYPNVEIDEPICYNYSETKDSRIQWPFGYGLSYSSFEYSNLKITNEAKTSDEAVTLTFDIKNTGNVAADEVAQLYLSPTAKDQNIRPIQMQGFARVSLKAGETKTVTIKMYTEQFGFYTNNDGKRQWNIAPGKFTIKIGASSQDIKLKQDIALTGDKVNKPLRESYFSETTIK